MCVCVRACVRACVRVCVCVCVRACVHALRIVSRDKILRFRNTVIYHLIIIIGFIKCCYNHLVRES